MRVLRLKNVGCHISRRLGLLELLWLESRRLPASESTPRNQAMIHVHDVPVPEIGASAASITLIISVGPIMRCVYIHSAGHTPPQPRWQRSGPASALPGQSQTLGLRHQPLAGLDSRKMAGRHTTWNKHPVSAQLPMIRPS